MPTEPERLDELEAIASRVRGHVLRSVHAAQGGHIGGPLSVTDILVALYFRVARIDPQRPNWPDRDRIVLSKGHSCVALYAVMAERGYFPVEELATFDAINSRLQGHPDMTKLPGLDMSTGSLGQGISVAAGMALGAKLRGQDFRAYAIIGDGESQEGQVWEAAFVAARYRLDNLIAILDYNRLQQYGWHGPDQMLDPAENARQRWQAFGWRVSEVDGHDLRALLQALAEARTVQGCPVLVIAHTIKGKGVSFMENDPGWHARVPSDEELHRALCELGQEGLTW